MCLVCLKKIDNNPNLCSKCNWPVCDDKCADSHEKMLECEVFANSANKVKNIVNPIHFSSILYLNIYFIIKIYFYCLFFS